MPHLVLEYSDNVLEKQNLSELFQQLHVLLAQYLPTKMDACKSRAIEYDKFKIGSGDVNNAFIHVAVKVMPGRTQDTLNQTASVMLAKLKDYFAESCAKLDLQLSVEVTELAASYCKILSE